MKVKKSVTIDKDIWDKLEYLSFINGNNLSLTLCLLLRRVTDDFGNYIFTQSGSIKFKE